MNALGFTGRALYLTPMFFRNRAVELLIDPDLTADNLNDASLGTPLDVLYERHNVRTPTVSRWSWIMPFTVLRRSSRAVIFSRLPVSWRR